MSPIHILRLTEHLYASIVYRARMSDAMSPWNSRDAMSLTSILGRALNLEPASAEVCYMLEKTILEAMSATSKKMDPEGFITFVLFQDAICEPTVFRVIYRTAIEHLLYSLAVGATRYIVSRMSSYIRKVRVPIICTLTYRLITKGLYNRHTQNCAYPTYQKM